MVDFTNEEKKNYTSIDYLGVLDYIENNRGVPYSNPTAEGLDPIEQRRLLDVKAKGREAVAEMKKMVDLCKKKDNLDRCEPMSWLDGSNTRTREYLWAQLKYSKYKDCPESISIFAEMSAKTNRARFRLSLELKNDGSDKAVVANYHRHLDLPIQTDGPLVYVSGSNEYGYLKTLKEDQDTIKAKIVSGDYKKVQLCRIIEREEGLTNAEIETELLDGVEKLIPYYNYVLGLQPKDAYWPSLNEYDPVDLPRFR